MAEPPWAACPETLSGSHFQYRFVHIRGLPGPPARKRPSEATSSIDLYTYTWSPWSERPSCIANQSFEDRQPTCFIAQNGRPTWPANPPRMQTTRVLSVRMAIPQSKPIRRGCRPHVFYRSEWPCNVASQAAEDADHTCFIGQNGHPSFFASKIARRHRGLIRRALKNDDSCAELIRRALGPRPRSPRPPLGGRTKRTLGPRPYREYQGFLL